MAGAANPSVEVADPPGLAKRDPRVDEGLFQTDRESHRHVGEDHDLPAAPEALADTGLSESFVSDLVTKHLYRYGVLTGCEIAAKLCLPFPILEQILEESIARAHAEKRGGRGLGGATDRFSLTEQGRAYARDLLSLDTYIGPAPVPLDQYSRYIAEENLRRIQVTDESLREAWRDFILDDRLFALLGPAIRSAKSCFLYGPPGTGKTIVAKAIASFLDRHGGHVGIPHALFVGGSIIRIYDPIYHERISTPGGPHGSENWRAESPGDRRWVLCRRPTVVAGGELTLDMLDLRYNATTRYYEAPLQLKANCGVLVIDDFGRQLVRPKDLLNRWIVPLEERIDFLTLHTGKKFSVPFEQLVIFATNLDPTDLADEAFLRRIRYKIFVGEPSLASYKAIFEDECRRKGIVYSADDLDRVMQKYYTQMNRPLRACDPRDITDQIVDYCTFNGLSLQISYQILDHIVSSYFTGIQTIARR